jgi:hypothetical protein
MAKDRKARRFPLVLSMLGTAAATATAVYYRRRLDEVAETMIEVPESLLREVREGATLMYWVDETGKKCYKTTPNSLVKNLSQQRDRETTSGGSNAEARKADR